MAETRQHRIWAIAILILVVVIIISVVVIWSRYRPGQPIEITLPAEQGISGNVYIDGAVANPGIYPFTDEDTIGSLVQSAGGTISNDEAGNLKLYVSPAGADETTQKININRAEAWLLEALPGIGSTKAQAIVAYRQKNGPFKNVSELTKVEGISLTLYEQIKNLVTVSD